MIDELNIVEWDKLPRIVKDIVSSKDENEDDYKELARIEEELAEIGWFMDYYLTAEITELRPMTQKEIQEYEDKQENEIHRKLG